jgi:hypothetical protein
VAVVISVTPTTVNAQPREGRFIDVALGLGISAPYDESHVDGLGFFAEGEYVFAFSSWAGIRPYAGVLLTWPDDTDYRCTDPDFDCEVTAKIALIGGKGRLAAPIPWVAPFIELGLGASLGVIRTRTPEEDVETSGAALHIPFSLGLALGPDHAVEVAFVYYFHPAEHQFSGAAAIGLSFPLDQSPERLPPASSEKLPN